MKLAKPTYKLVTSTDDLLENIALALTDATLPANKLKRKATRKCLNCTAPYKSDVSLLCDNGFCSEVCRDEYQRLTLEISNAATSLLKELNQQ